MSSQGWVSILYLYSVFTTTWLILTLPAKATAVNLKQDNIFPPSWISFQLVLSLLSAHIWMRNQAAYETTPQVLNKKWEQSFCFTYSAQCFIKTKSYRHNKTKISAAAQFLEDSLSHLSLWTVCSEISHSGLLLAQCEYATEPQRMLASRMCRFRE